MKFLFLISIILTASSFTIQREENLHRCVSYGEVSCINDQMLICPPGYIDGCIDGATSKHRCVLAHEAPSCEIKMNMKCPANFYDGCTTGETDTHECLPKNGPSCDENMTFMCPSGFQDACRI